MKQRFSRRELLQSASAASLSGALNPALAASENDPAYTRMPSTNEIFEWVETLWQFGDRDKYRYRMPGTLSDHQATEFLERKFKEFGLQDVRRELVPIPVMFPDRWTLSVRARGKSEQVPCWFFRYAAATPPEGITAELVYVGQGSKQDFQANARPIAGNIVLVDLISHGMAINDGEPPIFVYDPNHTLAGDLYSESFPVDNQPGSMALARQLGAIGYVGILTYRAKDTCQEYHGPKVGTEVISGLTVSPSSGARIKELLAGGPVEATMVLTENPEPRLGSTPTFGKWGVTYNIYGVLPGASEEVLVVLSHHDGGATNEASGASVVLALAKYFAQFPAKERRKTLLFFLMGAHFGLRPPLLDQARGFAAVKDKIACALNIEMIGRQFKVRNGKYVATGLASPTMFGVKNANPKLVAVVRDAIEKHKLNRSMITDHLGGEGWVLDKWGGVSNVISHISVNAPQFSLDDRPETVNKEALRPTACAFADIIGRLDPITARDLES